MSKQILVVADMDSIHGYVFASQRMREIRGGSYIVGVTIQDETINLLTRSFGTGNYNPKRCKFDPTLSLRSLDWKGIYCDGGALKVKFSDKGNAEKFRRALEKMVRNETISGSITTAAVPIDDTKSYAGLIEEAETKLRLAKDGKSFAHQINNSPFHRLCNTCGVLPVAEFDQRDPSDLQFVCSSCYKKRTIFGGKDRLPIYNKIEKAAGVQIELPKDFSEIAQQSTPPNYLGFIVADGNRMGEHLQKIEFPKDNPTKADEIYSDFSSAISDISSEALISAVIEALRDDIPTSDIHNQRITLPIEVVILGGDDLVLVTRADKAIQIAQHYCLTFHEKTKNSKAIPSPISMSAGVVIAKHKFPFLTAHRLADELLKSAKKLSRKINQRDKEKKEEVSTIDFMVVTEAAIGALEETRANLKYEEYFRNGDIARELEMTARPYKVDELSRLLMDIKELRSEGFPRNKLKGFRQLLRRGFEQSHIEYTLMKRKLPQEILDKMTQLEYVSMTEGAEPWKYVKDKNYVSILSDMAEIYDFVR